MRFQVFLRLFDGGCSDEHRLWAIDESTRLMESFDKAGPDYQDPAKLEETIQARVDNAIQEDRIRMRGRLVEFLRRGIRGGFAVQDHLYPGHIVRWDIPDSQRIADEVITPPTGVCRG